MSELERKDGVWCHALFSDDRVYRYVLTRQWASRGGWATFVGLNPSTADERVDDPTIRRCMGFARQWGCGAMVMLNIFAFRATDPKQMKRAADPVGPENDVRLWDWTSICDAKYTGGPVVACWGAHGSHLGRSERVANDLRRSTSYGLSVFGRTKAGEPKHPLYLAKDTPLKLWA